jgi:hypothetical protein
MTVLILINPNQIGCAIQRKMRLMRPPLRFGSAGVATSSAMQRW